jgi:protein-S-isoprenylcysteine O-methyltransferase Ste14
MALGTIILYLGIAVLAGSISAVVVTLLFSSVLLIYIRKTEEEEMLLRFGQSYVDYREHTPFLIPRFWHHRQTSQKGVEE